MLPSGGPDTRQVLAARYEALRAFIDAVGRAEASPVVLEASSGSGEEEG